MKISLIIPSRERMGLLVQCLNSFFTKANNPANVEAIIIGDTDDISFDNNFDSYISYTGYDIKTYFVPRSEFCQKDYNNFGGKMSTGDLLWVLNDDCIMVTNHWDEILEKHVNTIFSNQKDKILYLGMIDGTHGTNSKHIEQKSCCFPIISRESFRAADNTIMPNEINMWGADIALYNIYTSLKANRIYHTDDIELEHHSTHSSHTPRETDAVNFNMAKISKKCHLTNQEYRKYIDSINKEIIL